MVDSRDGNEYLTVKAYTDKWTFIISYVAVYSSENRKYNHGPYTYSFSSAASYLEYEYDKTYYLFNTGEKKIIQYHGNEITHVYIKKSDSILY